MRVFIGLFLNFQVESRKKHSLKNGFEARRGFTYLAKLAQKVKLGEDEHVISSTKSSAGRLFSNIRFLADYNSGFDVIYGVHRPNSHLEMWLLIQPSAFNFVFWPGIPLNQLRFFRGLDAKLSASEVHTEFERNPLLYILDKGELIPFL